MWDDTSRFRLPAFAPVLIPRLTYLAPTRCASSASSGRPAFVQEVDGHPSTQVRCRGQGRCHNVEWLVVDRDQDVDLGRRTGPWHGAVAVPPVPGGPPEAGRLHQVEDLCEDEQAEQTGVPDSRRSEEPLEVPDGQNHVQRDQQP